MPWIGGASHVLDFRGRKTGGTIDSTRPLLRRKGGGMIVKTATLSAVPDLHAPLLSCGSNPKDQSSGLYSPQGRAHPVRPALPVVARSEARFEATISDEVDRAAHVPCQSSSKKG
uniref:Uncharacterized protein n=1 Tax=Coccidioides posadasii RMSCC 3488 TaxID=454284 RepID=A0A0J6FCR4_COCPO|nr:hypothetical protein CPAG_03401 [Coccidioides posadasii RMSCC 3488]